MLVTAMLVTAKLVTGQLRNSRGSVIRPVNADAATVAGDPMYTLELGSPMRPLKLRVVDVMHTSSGPITPM
jgi:hypothetical protein